MSRVSGATVDVWAVGDNGAPQRKLGTTTTDASGGFSLSIPGYTGWTLLCAYGGNYVDEATGSPASIPEATPLMGVALADGTPHVVTPVTSMLTCIAQEQARDPGMSFRDAVENAIQQVLFLLGIEDAHLLPPADLTAGPASAGPAAHYGAVISGYSELAFGLNVSGAELSYAAARDSKDGNFDGFEFKDPIEIRPSVNLGTAFLARLGNSATDWMDLNPNNASGLDSSDLPGLASIMAGMIPKGPRIQAVWDGHSPLGGGSTIDIRGWGFGLTPQLFVNDVPATILSSDDGRITAETPALSAAGDYDLKVTADLGLSYISRLGVRYFDEDAAPSVDAVEPAEGPRCGGTPVKIKGRNLDLGTTVSFGGTPALIIGGTFPYDVTAIAPKASAAGATDLRVENGAGLSLTLNGRYTYKDKDVGRTFDQTSFSGQTYTTIFTKPGFDAGEFRISGGFVETMLDGAGLGTFTRDEMTITAAGTSTSSASGTAFYSAEGNNFQFATFDAGTLASNLYAGFIHPGAKTISGLTAGGTFYSYPHGSGLGNSALKGEYGVTMSLTKLTPSLSFTNYSGTLEFDGDGYGGMSVKGFEREGEGSGFRQEVINAPFTYDVTPDGGVDLRLNPDSAVAWDFQGRVTPDGGFVGAYYAGTGAWQGRVASFVSVRLADGVAPEDLRGEYAGGFLRQTTDDDGGGALETEIQAKLEDFLAEYAGGAGRWFTAYDGVKVRADFLNEELVQRGDVRSVVAGQRGRLEDPDGSVLGYVAPSLGYVIRSGTIAESAQFDDNLTFGSAVRVPTYYSKYSLDGLHHVLNVKSYWLDPQSPPTGDEVNETSLGTVRFNPGKALTIGGDSYLGFGGFDDLSLSRKAVTRSALVPSVSFGAYPDLKAEWAYGFLNNRFRLVLAERDVTSPLAGYRPGFVEGTGLLSPTGSSLGFASSAKSGTTSFTALAPLRTSLSLGASYRFGSSFFDFDGSTGATHGRMERGTFTVSGSTLMQNYFNRTFVEAGSPSTSSGSRSGTHTANADGSVDFNLGGQLLGGFAVGDNADLLVLSDFGSNNQTGIFLATRQAASTPPLFDYGYSLLGKDMLGLVLPAATFVTLGSGTFTPTRNAISLAGLDQIRTNLNPEANLGRQFNSGTATANPTGGLSFTFGSNPYFGGVTSDGCFGFGLPGGETEAPTTMRIAFFMNF